MLKQRVITALILLPLVLAAIFWLPNALFALVMGAVLLQGGAEWANMMGESSLSQRLPMIALLATFMVIVYQFEQSWTIYLACGFWLASILWVRGYPGSASWWFTQPRLFVMGLLILVPAWQALVMLQRQPDGAWWVLYVFLLVWSADTGAYFVGRAFGKRKLAPSVSPGKSLEGMLGGLLLTMIVAALVAHFTQAAQHTGMGAFLAISLLATLASVLGDLVESMVKRQRGIKDSSQVLPGHGGVLDRIDSITAAAPVFCAGMLLLGAFR